MVPLAHMSKFPNDISISSVVFAGRTLVPNRQTDKQTTLRATYVAKGRIYAMYVMRPKILSTTSFNLCASTWSCHQMLYLEYEYCAFGYFVDCVWTEC